MKIELTDIIKSFCDVIKIESYSKISSETDRLIMLVCCDSIVNELAENNIENSKINESILVIKHTLTKEHDDENKFDECDE